jgi:hypothetical protein
MTALTTLRDIIIGKPRDPMNPETRRHVVLIAFLAWVGLGADGLSSSCYGPEMAFLALGDHAHLGLYLAFATAATVFIISLAYNQVIELFPNGGGGYKVATQLIGPNAGLVSGAALLVDYVLTITISIASGMDALFSLLPLAAQSFKLATEVGLTVLLITLNLRGMKESIKVLLPIFIGFVLTHLFLIGYGIAAHAEGLPRLIPEAVGETAALSRELGWIFVASLFLRAYSLGGASYTGLEAVSNNVNTLAEPRVKTGKWTMFYLALSLSAVAGGIILLYLLWASKPVAGQTLNAVVFQAIINSFGGDSQILKDGALAVVMALEAGLLLVAANTGFLGGPAVLANMSADYWVPRHFRELSNRMVKQNGILVMGVSSLAILMWTRGAVAVLVVLYSINVFLTFSMSLLGLAIHWWRQRRDAPHWRRRIALSVGGFIVTAGILTVTLVEKFTEGGWLTVIITSVVIVFCLLIRDHYEETRVLLSQVDRSLEVKLEPREDVSPPKPDPAQPTAIFLVGKHRGVGLHALMWVQRLFPGHFKNCIFLAVGEVDAQSFDGQGALRTLRYTIENSLRYYVTFCHRHDLAAEYRMSFGTEPVDEFVKLAERTMEEYPNSVCFASKLIFAHVNILTRWLHNRTPLAVQERLHQIGKQMVILPMNVS